MAVLMGMAGDVKGKSFPIDQDEISLGRSGDNTIPLNNATVSGRHATITREGDSYVLRDLGSTNGTRVNSREVKEAVLRPKDLVQVGSVEFLFNSEALSFEDAQAAFSKTEVLESKGPAEMPKSFGNISPFGARRRESMTVWIPVIIGLGIVALLVVVYLFVKLFSA
ncbi:MAG: FHA domain-containing protein [Kiritimatiellae bacterium]|nr:FHA domain-containing protein [Kiritimatiellia bacterium]MCO5061738.1 FHA domain-containing protein [Kiritimatiellia bacterium]MCO6399716.1 FHA domain-containing protein [Verrucomicrobiota bacterium]